MLEPAIFYIFRHKSIGEIKVPVLILFGKQDRLINPSAALTFHDRIAGSEVVLLDGVGHLPMEQIPDKTAADLKSLGAQDVEVVVG